MNNFYVYQLRRSDNPLPFYVGKGYARRAWAHFLSKSLEKNTYKNNVIKKAEADGVAVLVEFIFEGLINDEALAYEVWAISAYGRIKQDGGCLTNMTLGGEGRCGDKHTPEAIEKIRKASTGRTASDETRLKISVFHKGKVVSEETKKRMSLAQTGRVISEDARKKISDFQTGKITSDETKAKMSESMKGLTRSDEGKANMKAANQALPKLKCPHCDVCATSRQLTRYHKNNCKNRIISKD